MENTQKTADQDYQNNLPSMQTILSQHPTTTFVDPTQNPDSQGYENGSTNYNDQINRSGLMYLPDNDQSRDHINTNEIQNGSPPMAFTQQFGVGTPQQILIKYQPRSKYHPRTQKENKKATHYIRCEENEKAEYPTISLSPAWHIESTENFIEVALVDIRDQLHPYTIETKERNSSVDQLLISGEIINASNILYFGLTNEDFASGFKIFMIELIKSKQDNGITKNLIRERELTKSKLRFTRFFRDANGSLHRDEASTIYSCVMTESYGDVAVKHTIPQFGPMSGNQLLDIVFTGLQAGDKKKLSFEICEKTNSWMHKIQNFDSTGSTVHFLMPAFPYPQMKSALASLIIYYEGEPIYESPYLYDTELDLKLNCFNLNNSTKDDTGPTTSNNGNGCNQDLADNSCSSSIVPEKMPRTNPRKRQHGD